MVIGKYNSTEGEWGFQTPEGKDIYSQPGIANVPQSIDVILINGTPSSFDPEYDGSY